MMVGEPTETLRTCCLALWIGLLNAAAVGCSQAVDHRPLSAEAYLQASLQDRFVARFWGDEQPEGIEEGVRKTAVTLRARFPEAVDSKPETAPFQRLLAISGGGANGAFGAGLLAGWTESGKRVEFDVVTGVSTGAIIAPFAFLGPNYDETILEIYSSGARDKVFEYDIIRGLLFGSAVADTTPLKDEIEKYITLDLIRAIAEEHEKARNLFIITTHFDANRPVVWDVGEIATGRDEKAVRLIRQIIQASAAIPAFFPPVPIEFSGADGVFTELHVDGGVSRNVFAYPAQIKIAELNEMMGLHFRREVYVIVNSNEQLKYTPAPTGVLSIARRAISVLLQSQLNADVERIYFLSRRDEIDFKMIAIPESFEANGSIEFDPEYMKELVKLGFDIGVTGEFWTGRPRTVAQQN